MKPLSACLLAAVILTAGSPLTFQKAAVNDQPQATPAWSASLSKQPSSYTGGVFKPIVAVQEYLNKHNLTPGASLGGGVQLLYEVE
ncbi:MAG: hypothetical protein GX348_04590 [Veillonellaceae bacterium]|jgi:hypothetical protein|nr:hypothetical protein [Veillonellaceae bacterium]